MHQKLLCSYLRKLHGFSHLCSDWSQYSQYTSRPCAISFKCDPHWNDTLNLKFTRYLGTRQGNIHGTEFEFCVALSTDRKQINLLCRGFWFLKEFISCLSGYGLCLRSLHFVKTIFNKINERAWDKEDQNSNNRKD